MGYYAIGIGGTGAKCLESLIHLAAAGMMPTNKDLHVLFVDPDNAKWQSRPCSADIRATTCDLSKILFELGQITTYYRPEIVPAEFRTSVDSV